jgi:hypothetical protein
MKSEWILYLIPKYLHENGHNHIDQNELGDEDKNDKKARGKNRINATISFATFRRIAVITKGIL